MFSDVMKNNLKVIFNCDSDFPILKLSLKSNIFNDHLFAFKKISLNTFNKWKIVSKGIIYSH